MQATSYYPLPSDAIEIAQRLGLHRAGRGWRGNCPLCNYSNSLALDEREGRALLWCASCGDREGLAHLLRSAGALPDRAAPPPDRQAEAERVAERIERARALWAGGERIEADTPAALYLERRCISHVISYPALRWRTGVPHPNGGSRRLALLAEITGPDGKFAAIQRIFLKPDGTKADIEPVKASLGNVTGGAVRLQSCSAELAVAEGLESAAAAGVILGLPAWAAISAGNLARGMILPVEIRSVVIAADHDGPGLRAAEDAATRWRDEGRAVRIIRASESGHDANDVLTQARP